MRFDVVRQGMIYIYYVHAFNTYNILSVIYTQDPIAALSGQDEQDYTVDDVSCNFYDYTLVTNDNL